MTWMLDKAFLDRLVLGAYDAQTIAKRVGVSLDVAKRFFGTAMANRRSCSSVDPGCPRKPKIR
jgi:hypothetical protein